MSFYISYTSNISNRKTPVIFFDMSTSSLCLLSEEDEIDLVKYEELSNDNLFKVAITYIVSHFRSEVEILLPSLDKEQLDKGFKAISNYLLNNEASIGLLTSDELFISSNIDLIDRYGITYSNHLPKEITIEESTISNKAPLRFSKDTRLCSKANLILDESFNELLIKYLNESNKSNVEVYTKGGITRQVFSKILSNKNLIPKKETIICLIIGMELSYPDSIKLLSSAGYALSGSIILDVVITKYLKKGIYDLTIINDELNERECPLLGWKPRNN